VQRKHGSWGWNSIPTWGAFVIALLTFFGGVFGSTYVQNTFVNNQVTSQNGGTTVTITSYSVSTWTPANTLIKEFTGMTKTDSSYSTPNYGADFGWWVANVSLWTTLSVNYLNGQCGNGYTCTVSFGSTPCVPSGQNLLLCKGYTYAPNCNSTSCYFTAPGQSQDFSRQNIYVAIFCYFGSDNFTIFAYN
jgi:hypothetical protein